MLAIVLACAVLTYGGVSLFVVAFAVYPIAVELFRAVDVPKRLIPATIALGAFTFTMTALPGTPAIQNAIPMPYFGTTPFAAPGLDLIGGTVMLALGAAWLLRSARRAIATGGLDALPHNGAVITLLAICKLTHRQSYLDIFVVAVLLPLVALAAVVVLGTVFGSF